MDIVYSVWLSLAPVSAGVLVGVVGYKFDAVGRASRMVTRCRSSHTDAKKTTLICRTNLNVLSMDTGYARVVDICPEVEEPEDTSLTRARKWLKYVMTDDPKQIHLYGRPSMYD